MKKRDKKHEPSERREDVIVEPSKDGRGEYCNVAGIFHTRNEFVLEFHFQLASHVQLVSRIITNPRHAKALMYALEENVNKYESQFGEIDVAKNEGFEQPGESGPH